MSEGDTPESQIPLGSTTDRTSGHDDLNDRLARLVLQATERDEPPGGLSADEPLFGVDSRLGLDSLDALQLSMAIQADYGLRMPDSKQTRRAFATLGTLAAHLRAHAGVV